uniref:Serpentine Receptor, class T n=1 Tax=Steinernema glaseri TaxID=37863 RepID=A0A1I7ZBQ0_9BILA
MIIVGGTMDSMQLMVGTWYIVIAVFLSPAYFRIVYLFLTQKKYRDLECYRIMTQIGFVQLTAAPTTFALGVMQLTDGDRFKIANFFMVIFSASMSVEIMLSLVLAINRLKVIFDIEKLDPISKVLNIFSWFYGFSYVVIVHTPLCGFYQLPGQYIGKYDFNKPYTWLLEKIDAYLLISCVCTTLLLYMTIIVYMAYLRSRSSNVARLTKERSILIFAGVHFCFDMTLQVAFFFANLPPGDLSDLLVALVYFLNALLTAPVLYLLLTRSLRLDFVLIFVKLLRGPINTVSVVVSSSHVSSQNVQSRYY